MATRAKKPSPPSDFSPPPRGQARGEPVFEEAPVLAIIVHLCPGPGAMTPRKRGSRQREAPGDD